MSEPKAFSGKPSSTMRARFDGAAIGYKVWEDALILNPKLKTQLAFHKLIAPPPVISLPPDEYGAVFNTAAHPFGFQVGVSAVRKAIKLSLILMKPPFAISARNSNVHY